MKARASSHPIAKLTAKRGLARTRDIAGGAKDRVELARLVETGQLEKIARGTYAIPNRKRTENHQYAEIAIRAPSSSFCLLSALRFHGLTTQNPHELWIAIGNKTKTPRIDYPPIRVFRFSGKSLSEGIETHLVDGVPVHVYSVAKTVADCFKFRNKIGLDVAMEALRECRREKRASNDEIWKFAKICRVTNVMRPYLESLD